MNIYYKGEVVSVGGGSGASPLKDKNILFIGDSNLQYMGQALTDYLVSTTGCARVTNLAVAGNKWAYDGDATTATTGACGQVNNAMKPFESTGLCTDYDVICIMMGTNDSDATAGTLSDTGTDTVAGAMNYCLKKLLWYCRESAICGVIPPQSEYSQTKGTRFNVIKEVYDYYSIPTYDFFTSGQVVFNTKVEGGNASGTGNKASYLGDPVHLGANGKNQFYHKITRFMESLI